MPFLNKTISLYGVLGAIGFFFGLIYVCSIYTFVTKQDTRYKAISLEDLVYVYVWSVIFAILGAKVLYLIIESKNIISEIVSGKYTIYTILNVLTGGFVFYGGLMGAFIGLFLACKYFRLDCSSISTFLLPALPIMHGFGRIGCHCVGCCFGKQTNGLIHVVYENSSYAPNNIALIPVQLIEASFEFIVAAILIVIITRKKENVINLYLVSYSVFRFLLEFLRGDKERGYLGQLSTSQWISLLILLYVIIIHCRKKKLTIPVS